LPATPTRPEEPHPALSAAYNAGDHKAAHVIKPGRVTDGPDD
jgi:hypothetical protein